MSRKRRRGSVLIFCVVLMASVSTILMSAADVGQFTVTRQTRLEDEARLDYTEESAIAVMTQLALEKSLILPSTTSLDLNGMKVVVEASAGTGARSRLIELNTTVSGRRATRTRDLLIGKRGNISPLWFAFGSESDFIPGANVSIDGDAFLSADYKSGGTTCTVSGDLYTQRSAISESPTVTGKTLFGKRSITPILDSGAYASAATLKFSGDQLIKVLAFLNLGSYHTLWHVEGNVTLDVKYSGKGTLFVAGNVTVKDFDRASFGDEGLLIVDGNVDFQTMKFGGYLICSGSVTQSAGPKLGVDGAIWAGSFNIGSRTLTVNFNKHFWNNPDWDKRMRVPGMW